MAMVMENQQPVAQLVPGVVAPPLPPPPPPPPPPPTSLPPAYKHHCKVCNKGFMCGPALGGHMRTHGVTDDVLSAAALDDDDAAGPCGGGTTGDDASSEAAASPWATANKRMYALRANPGRLKSCRVCENCGMEFTSWKSLLDHGRCSYDEEEDDGTEGAVRRSPPLLRGAADDDDGEEVEEADMALIAAGWSKGKRTRRGKLMEAVNGSVTEVATSPSSEEEDLANCLVMLSSSSRSVQPSPLVVVDADQESCPLPSKDVETNSRLLEPQPISMMMAPTTTMPELKLLPPPQVVVRQQLVSTVPRGLFECKACKKVFTSHQALGGHRASHKNVKGCFAAKLESNRSEPPPQPAAAVADISADDGNTTDGNPINSGSSVVVMATAAPETVVMQANEAPAPSAGSPIKKKGKVHECSICHRVFTSGQALGGHKRCHWLTTGSGDPTGAVANLHHPIVSQDHVMHAMCQQLTLGRPMFDAAHPILDLNVPMNRSAERPATKAKQQATELNDSVLCLNAPASLYMQSWTVHSNASNVNVTATSSRNDAAGAAATEDEADSRNAKKGKIISDLKDMNVAGETSPWLQVGIGLPSESKEKSIQE